LTTFEECQAVGEDDITLSTLEAVKPGSREAGATKASARHYEKWFISIPWDLT